LLVKPRRTASAQKAFDFCPENFRLLAIIPEGVNVTTTGRLRKRRSPARETALDFAQERLAFVGARMVHVVQRDIIAGRAEPAGDAQRARDEAPAGIAGEESVQPRAAISAG